LRITELFLLAGGLPKCHRLVTEPPLTMTQFEDLMAALEMIRDDASPPALAPLRQRLLLGGGPLPEVWVGTGAPRRPRRQT